LLHHFSYCRRQNFACFTFGLEKFLSQPLISLPSKTMQFEALNSCWIFLIGQLLFETFNSFFFLVCEIFHSIVLIILASPELSLSLESVKLNILLFTCPIPCISRHRDENCFLIVILFFILILLLIAMCYCIIIDLSYIMYNDPWRWNKSKSKSIAPLFFLNLSSEYLTCDNVLVEGDASSNGPRSCSRKKQHGSAQF
jgi:uncharacterized membrane protein